MDSCDRELALGLAMTDHPATITKALHDVMSKVGYVQKKGRNEFHRYNYAGEADLLEALRPAMLEAGLLLIPSGVEHSPIDEYGNTHVSVAYTLAHKDGDVWPEKIVAFGSGNDRNSKGGVQDKGTYKALTGANKYLLFKLFQIETGDDPEKTEHDSAPPKQAKRPVQKPAQTKTAPSDSQAPKRQITLLRAQDGSVTMFPATEKGAIATFQALDVLLEESPDNWEANKEVVMRLLTTVPDLSIGTMTVKEKVDELVTIHEGIVP